MKFENAMSTPSAGARKRSTFVRPGILARYVDAQKTVSASPRPREGFSALSNYLLRGARARRAVPPPPPAHQA